MTAQEQLELRTILNLLKTAISAARGKHTMLNLGLATGRLEAFLVLREPKVKFTDAE